MNPKVFHGPVLAIITAALVGCTYFQRNSRDFDSRHQRNTMSLAGLRSLAPDEPVLLTKDSGLSDYLAYAALNNPGLEAAFNRWKAALEQIPAQDHAARQNASREAAG